MWKLKTSLLFVVLAAVCLPQSATELASPEIRRVGNRLSCKCGACGNTVGTCQMLQCHYTHPARQRIAELQKAGMNDDQIVDTFVKERGLVALAVPPAEGFNLVGWVMPYTVAGLGLLGILFYLKRFRRRQELQPIAVQPVVDERYRKRIEQEMSELD